LVVLVVVAMAAFIKLVQQHQEQLEQQVLAVVVAEIY
jgi:hypothetical protein